MMDESRDASWNFHTCDQCIYRTKSVFVMVNHVRRHRTMESNRQLFSCSRTHPFMYKCYICNFETDLLVNFDKHVKATHKLNAQNSTQSASITHSLINEFKCYSCNSCDFETFSSLVAMKHICSGSKDDQGIIEYFAEYSNNTNHNKNSKFSTVKEKIELLKCEQCSYRTKYRRHLNTHKLQKHKVSENDKPFKCEHCSHKARKKHHLIEHIFSRHTAKEDIAWFECEHCSYKGKMKYQLRRHILCKHTANEDIKWFQCEQCSYKSKRRYNLKSHMLARHTTTANIVWFECEKCTFRSKLKTSLNRHILSKKHTANEDI